MSHRVFIALIALSFIALPVLCTAGVAAHACECGENTCCESEEESQCDADPCGSLTTARVESDGFELYDAELAVVSTVDAVEIAPPEYSPVAAFPAPRRLPTAAIVHPIRV